MRIRKNSNASMMVTRSRSSEEDEAMIFEGTWTEDVWTSTDTSEEIYAAYEDGKIPVIHIPAYEFVDQGITITDELYVTLYSITEESATIEGETSSLYEYLPSTIYIAGGDRNLDTDETGHLTISTK